MGFNPTHSQWLTTPSRPTPKSFSAVQSKVSGNGSNLHSTRPFLAILQSFSSTETFHAILHSQISFLCAISVPLALPPACICDCAWRILSGVLLECAITALDTRVTTHTRHDFTSHKGAHINKCTLPPKQIFHCITHVLKCDVNASISRATQTELSHQTLKRTRGTQALISTQRRHIQKRSLLRFKLVPS